MAKATMAKKPFRLSPNEEAAIIKKEKERRRKLRLQQVREQEKAFAQKLRKHAKDKREKEVRVLAENLQRHWLDDQVNKERGLEILYEKSLNSVGEGHRAADAQKTEEKEEIRLAISIHNEKIAAERHNEALRELQIQKNEQFQKENAHLMARKSALEIERARAAVMASLPPPPEDPLETLMKEDPTPPVKLTSADGFSTTLYHLPSGYVEKAEPHEQGDAKQAAVEEEERMKEETTEMERDAKERHQKAILRHKHAKEKVDLEQDFNQLMVDLGHLEQIDRRRRQKVLNKIPHKVFQPPHRRLEEKEERQQDLEQAFEDMYMAKTDYSGDLTLALEPKAPETDPALDLSADTEHLDKVATPIGSPKKADFPIGLDKDVSAAGPGVQDEAKQMESTGADPKKESLRKLMNKIKTQREEWAQKSMQESTEVCVDKKPEKIQLADMHTDAEKPEREADAWAPEQDGLQPDSQPQPSTADSLPPMAQQTQGGDGTADAISDEPILAGSNTLLHPYEQASLIRSKQVTELEQRQEEQRRMMEIQELQRRQLEEQILRDRIAQQELQQMLEENRQKILQSKERLSSKFGGHQAPLTSNQADALRRQDEEEQRRKIHEHQQKLLQQQRQSKQGLSEAKARLQRNREMLMQKYPQVRLPSEPYQPAPIQQPHPSGFFPPPMPPQMGYTSIPSQYPAVHPQQGFFQLPVQFHPPPSADPMRTPQVHTSMGPPSSVAMQAVPTEFVPQSQGLATHAQHEAAKHDVQVGRDISMERQLPKESPAVEDALATSEQDISLSSHGIKSQGIHAKRQEQLAKQKEFLERQREGLLRQQAEQQRRMNERQQQLQAEINRQQEELELAQRLARESEEAKARSKLQRGPPPVQSLPPSESVHPHELSTIEEADISRDSEGRPVSRLGDAEAISAAEQPQTAARDDVPSYAQDVGKGILSYPSYTKMPSTSKDAGSAGISVTTDGRFTLSSFHQPLFPKVSQDDSVSSGSIVSDSITSGEIDSTPLYPSSAVKATAFSGRLPAHQEESEDAGQFSRAPLHRDWSATDSRPLDPVFLQRSKAFASDSDTSPESTKFFPLPKSSGSTNESESQEKKDGAAMTTASTTTMGTKLKDRMLKSLSHIPSSSSDEETGTKSRFDSRVQTSDRSDDSDGSFRPLPEALSEYSLSTPGQPSPLKSLLSVQQSLDKQTLESSTSSYQQKSLTFSPSKGGRPMYTTSSLGDTLSEHSLPTQDSYRFSPSKSRTRNPLCLILSLLNGVAGHLNPVEVVWKVDLAALNGGMH
ncbi:centrosomal protein of 295 kDa-like [Ptychodera flava]|uniref:centrosomal protein of 295 kDa-like n=1 Tax=Ptychodera flava TaxID=63121 RepID=UPI00396A7834